MAPYKSTFPIKKIIPVLSLFILLTIPAFSSSATDSTTVDAAELADRIIQESKKYIGKRYRYGGSGNYGFDCSGFTSHIYRKFGYELARSSKGQAKNGRAVEGPLSNLQKGDIVVFGSRRSRKTIGHVGIFIELDKSGNDFTFIHSSTSSGVTISHMREPYYDGRFICARRIIPDFVISDTTKKDYLFDTDNTVVKVDTLTLKENEFRILLLENGKWIMVEGEGKLVKPEGEDKIVLDPVSGNWNKIKTSKSKIPSQYSSSVATSSQSAQSAEKKTESSGSNSSSTSAVYHTIKSGDNLSTLARRYGTTVKSICTLNKITEKTILQLGRKLRIK